MPRSVNSVASRQRRKKVLDKASGYWGARSRLISSAKNAIDKAGVYAFRDRRAKKRLFRSLWIHRINAALHLQGTSYAVFMDKLHKSKLGLNRKTLAELAVSSPETFNEIVKQVG